jgi:NitT/TauT family transport system permease protein
MKDSTTKNRYYFFISVTILLVLWQIIAMVVNWETIFPTPISTAKELLRIITTKQFFEIIFRSLYRCFLSFLISAFFGILLGTLAGRFSKIEYLMEPLVTAIRALPTVAIILVSLVWLSTDMVPVFVGFLVSFPIVYSTAFTGYRSVDRNLIEMGRLYKIGRRKMVKEIYMPSIIPFINSSIILGVGLNLKVIIAAEVISQPGFGIGTSLQIERFSINVAGLFAWGAIVIFIVFLIEKFLKATIGKI